jgi:hypothetical protein
MGSGSGFWTALETAVEVGFGAGLETASESAFGTTLRTALERALGATLGTALGLALETALGTAFWIASGSTPGTRLAKIPFVFGGFGSVVETALGSPFADASDRLVVVCNTCTGGNNDAAGGESLSFRVWLDGTLSDLATTG